MGCTAAKYEIYWNWSTFYTSYLLILCLYYERFLARDQNSSMHGLQQGSQQNSICFFFPILHCTMDLASRLWLKFGIWICFKYIRPVAQTKATQTFSIHTVVCLQTLKFLTCCFLDGEGVAACSRGARQRGVHSVVLTSAQLLDILLHVPPLGLQLPHCCVHIFFECSRSTTNLNGTRFTAATLLSYISCVPCPPCWACSPFPWAAWSRCGWVGLWSRPPGPRPSAAASPPARPDERPATCRWQMCWVWDGNGSLLKLNQKKKKKEIG